MSEERNLLRDKLIENELMDVLYIYMYIDMYARAHTQYTQYDHILVSHLLTDSCRTHAHTKHTHIQTLSRHTDTYIYIHTRSRHTHTHGKHTHIFIITQQAHRHNYISTSYTQKTHTYIIIDKELLSRHTHTYAHGKHTHIYIYK